MTTVVTSAARRLWTGITYAAGIVALLSVFGMFVNWVYLAFFIGR